MDGTTLRERATSGVIGLGARATRRSPYEVVIEPGTRPHWRRRLEVHVLFAPSASVAAGMLATEVFADA